MLAHTYVQLQQHYYCHELMKDHSFGLICKYTDFRRRKSLCGTEWDFVAGKHFDLHVKERGDRGRREGTGRGGRAAGF